MHWRSASGPAWQVTSPKTGSPFMLAEGLAERDRRSEVLALAIDRIRCDGRGMCAEILPEMIKLDRWGYPIVQRGSIAENLVPHARRAVNDCPVLATAADRRGENHLTNQAGLRTTFAPSILRRSPVEVRVRTVPGAAGSGRRR